MIRKAASHDLDAVEQIYMERFIRERKSGRFSGWIAGVNPSRATLRRAIARGELYALRGDGRLCAAFSLRRGQPPEFEEFRWPVKALPKRIISFDLLCVSPLYDRRGLGTQMLHYAVGLAQRTRARAVRCSCLVSNVPMRSLLEKTGFAVAGERDCRGVTGETVRSVFYEYDAAPASRPRGGTDGLRL